MKVVFDVCYTFEHEQPFMFMSFGKTIDLPALPTKGTEVRDGKVFFKLKNSSKKALRRNSFVVTYDIEKELYIIEVYRRFDVVKSSAAEIRGWYNVFVAAGWRNTGHGAGLWSIIESGQ